MDELIRTLSDDQVKTVLRFAEALSRGRAVVSVCEVTEAGVPDPPDEPTPHPVSR